MRSRTPESKPKEVKSSGKRRGRPTLTNEELLDKALELFSELGYERTSIDAITLAAGMAKRTVYARYADKDALFRAALDRAIEGWIVPTEALRAAETDDLEETLLNVGHILVDNVMTPAGLRLLRITNAESVRMPKIGAYTYERTTKRTIVYLADLFRRRIGGQVATKDWREAALAFLYLVVGGPPTMTAWGVQLDDATIRHRTIHSVRLFMYGLVPRKQKAKQSDGRVSAAAPEGHRKLEDENRRLKQLLAEAMLEASSLREQLQR